MAPRCRPWRPTRACWSSPPSRAAEVAVGYLNAYRILLADLVVLTHCEDGVPALREAVDRRQGRAGRGHRPAPAARGAGRRCARRVLHHGAAGRARVLAAHLRDEHGAARCTCPATSATASRCARDLEGLDADVFLVEIKAAAIDVVAAEAVERGVRVVLADADVRAAGGGPSSTTRSARVVPRREAVA